MKPGISESQPKARSSTSCAGILVRSEHQIYVPGYRLQVSYPHDPFRRETETLFGLDIAVFFVEALEFAQDGVVVVMENAELSFLEFLKVFVSFGIVNVACLDGAEFGAEIWSHGVCLHEKIIFLSEFICDIGLELSHCSQFPGQEQLGLSPPFEFPVPSNHTPHGQVACPQMYPG